MLAPKCATYHGRSTFANPKYCKKAQSDKPCLYEIPYDTSDPANRFCPDGEETVTLEKESRSKLDKDTVKPYNYTYQNSLYETFKPPSKANLDQLERAKEVRKTMWRKTTKKRNDDDLEYVKSLEKELDELENQKRLISNIMIYFSKSNKMAKSIRQQEIYPVEKVNASKKPGKTDPTVHRILKTVCPLGGFQLGKATQSSARGKFKPRSSMFKRRLIAADQASVFMAMTSDHNRSELRIQDHSNEQSSSKLVPKSVPQAVKPATSRQDWILFHLHIAMLRITGSHAIRMINLKF
ncbi:hypothetical protein Tco_0404349 [Tanacetum coccineum]